MLRDELGESAEAPLTDAELLPDLIAGRLDALSTARLRAALQRDAELREELSLIESVRNAAPSPVIDIARIARALPHPVVVTPVIDLAARRAERARMSKWQWRTAAAVLLMIGGAGGVLLSRGAGRLAGESATVANIDLASGTLASAIALEELTDDELQLVLTRMEQFDGTTAVDSLDAGMEEDQ
jgi:hypothetical protein